MSDNGEGMRPMFDVSSMMSIGVALQKKSLEISQANTELTLEYIQSLFAARTPADFMKITRDYTQRQIAVFQKQANELVDLASTKSST